MSLGYEVKSEMGVSGSVDGRRRRVFMWVCVEWGGGIRNLFGAGREGMSARRVVMAVCSGREMKKGEN